MSRDQAPHEVTGVYALTLACFVLSGFAALLYQTVWTRQFAFVFGTADLAVATVLAAYMGGLAFGAAVATRLAPRITRPLLAYGVLELAIAIAALLVPFAIRGASTIAVSLFGSGDAPPSAGAGALAAFHLGAAFGILLVPTACMGATLPLLARATVTSDAELGARIGMLYALNTVGAVGGAIAAAFALLPRLGLERTVWIGAAANAIVFVLAAATARGTDRPVASFDVRSEPPADRAWIVLVVLLLSGATSFAYEVLWTRLLAHVLGGSTYAFATMLATFLAGIALGAALAARLATTPGRALRGLALAELGIAAGSLAAFRAMDALPGLALRLGAGREPTAPGNVALAGLAMLPSALAIGATFPFAVRALARGPEEAAVTSARVYAWNTVGAILGAVGAGFVLMPLLGYVDLVAAAAALNLTLAACVAFGASPRAPWIGAAALGGLLALLVRPPAMPWTLVGTSPLSVGRETAPPEFFAVGRSAGVAVAREGGVYKLRTNGLPEGVMLPPRRYRRAIPDRWLGALPFAARPDAQRVLVVGLGAGTALEALPRTLPDVDLIEIEPRVIEANRRFRAERAVDPLALAGLHLYVNDARGALNLTTKRYDIVVSQPSHPWTAGASHLYTREFFRVVRDHLEADGVFVQWIDLELVDRPLFATILATLLDAFPEVRVYRPFFRGTALFLASAAPLAVEANAARAIAAAPRELARAGIQTPEDVAAAFGLDTGGARALAAGAPLTTDDRNLLETRTIRVTRPLGYRGADEILGPLDPLPAALDVLDRLYLVRRLLADWDFPRADRIARALGDPVERLTASGIVALATERPDEGRRYLRQALAVDPSAYEARAALLRAERRRVVAGDADVRSLAVPFVDPARAVIEGWSYEQAGEWAALRGLEPRLAATSAADAVYGDALRLRAAWRVAAGAPDDAVAALALVDLVLPTSVDPEDYVLRARAALAASDPATAIESLTQALESATPGALRHIADRVGATLATIPPTPGDAAARVSLERKLTAVRR
ncbi:MAG: fused MFS/spermidine synthase [Deltaproteobacteria bacterium]|nr:fused MFS/spermidine synthase [Deltaproteobacteria bacterium]